MQKSTETSPQHTFRRCSPESGFFHGEKFRWACTTITLVLGLIPQLQSAYTRTQNYPPRITGHRKGCSIQFSLYSCGLYMNVFWFCLPFESTRCLDNGNHKIRGMQKRKYLECKNATDHSVQSYIVSNHRLRSCRS